MGLLERFSGKKKIKELQNQVKELEGQAKSKKQLKRKKRFALAKKGTFGTRLATSGLTVDEQLKVDLNKMRNASRKAGGDDAYMVRYLSMCETHIVGPEGFSFQSKVKKSDGTLDEIANAIVEMRFKRWGKKGTCDVTGQYSWTDIQTLFIKTVSQDGACLVREVKGFDNEFGYAVQLLLSDHLDLTYENDDYNGNRIRHGVELNSWDRPVAYHILVNHPGERGYTLGKNSYERIPADEILYGFYPFAVGQKIGVPWGHAALVELADLYDYREAEIVGSRVSSSKMFAYVADTDVEPDEDEEDEDFVEELEPGGGIIAPYGYDVKALDFGDVGKNFVHMVKGILRGAASGFDVNYNSLGNDLEGVNFSSLRHGVLEDRDNWKKRQRWMRETFLERIFESWLTMSLVSNAIPGYRYSDLVYLHQPKFQGRRWEWVNPLQDEKANTEAIKNRTKSQQSIIREAGGDPAEVLKEITEWEEATAHLQPQENSNNGKSDNEPDNNGDS